MKISSSVVAAAILVSLPGIASAQNAATNTGMYLGAGVGWNNVDDTKFTAAPGSTQADVNSDWMANVAFGYAYGNGLRTELEINRRGNDFDNLAGSVKSWGLFANGLYDINTGTPWTPYIGAGIGGLRINYDDVTPVFGSTVDDTNYRFGWQLIAGVSYALNDNLSLFGDARYMAAVDDPDPKTNSGVKAGTDYENTSVLVGFRWSFGAPARPAPMPAAAAPAPAAPPPAAPAAAAPAQPAIARNYLVFFDFDKSTLTNDAMQIVRTAATNAKSGNITRIALTGHADRSGSDAYNQRLSQRRADTVKAELVRMGLSANDISVQAKGESEPLVPTADGVKEPQNRRVQIVFQ